MSYLDQYRDTDFIKNAKEITPEVVIELLNNKGAHVSDKNIKLGNFTNREKLILDDSKYHALKLADWDLLIRATATAKLTYKSEFFDCDDFATLFKGCVCTTLANGVALVMNLHPKEGHAYNAVVVVDEDQDDKYYFKVVEPQQDSFVDNDEVTTKDTPYKNDGDIIFLM